MIPKPIDQITKEDIKRLVDDGVSEGLTLEFKQSLPGANDAAKREFLADVASLANAQGGDLVFGVADETDGDNHATGVAGSALGVSVVNISDVQIGLENLIREAIAPRLAGVHFQWVPGFSDGLVLVVRIRASVSAPHMVTFKGLSRFYGRHSQGKYPLDVNEIRSAFLNSETFIERARNFRLGRTARIGAGDTPLQLRGGSLLMLHLVPVDGAGAFAATASSQHAIGLPLLNGSPGIVHFNFDGAVVASTAGPSGHSGYLQVFRDGAIEAVDASMLAVEQGKIRAMALEPQLINRLTQYLRFLAFVEALPPVAIMLTLLDVRGREIEPPQNRSISGIAIDRDVLPIPEVVFDDLAANVARLLRPAFDTLWQAAGYPGSPNYDEAGERSG